MPQREGLEAASRVNMEVRISFLALGTDRLFAFSPILRQLDAIVRHILETGNLMNETANRECQKVSE